MHYVIGDVHGCYNTFMRLLGKLNLTEEDEVILVGDVIDRAPSSHQQKSMLDWVLANVTDNGQYQMVIGNHEYDLLDCIHRANAEGDKYKDKYNTLFETYYGFMEFAKSYNIDIDRIGKFIEDLPLYIKLYINNKKVFITHSWICTADGNDCIYNPNYALHEADIHSSVWDRAHSLYRDSCDNLVIHGHTPTVSHRFTDLDFSPGKVAIMGGNINVDCGCCFGPVRHGNLAAYCIESSEVTYAYSEEDIAAMIANIFKGDFKFASLIVKAYTGKVLELADLYTNNRDYDIITASEDIMASFAIMADFAKCDLEYKDLLSEKSDRLKELFLC